MVDWQASSDFVPECLGQQIYPRLPKHLNDAQNRRVILRNYIILAGVGVQGPQAKVF